MELREALEAAIDSASETESVEPAAEVVETGETSPTETASEAEARERDEKGRFKAKEAEQEAAGGDESAAVEASQPEAQETPVEPPKEPKPRPSSWKKELWEKYDSLPEDVQDYILQREEEARRGVGMYRQKAEFAERLEQEFVPYRDLMEKLGTTPEGTVRELMQAAAILHTGDRLTKAAFIQRLAVQHGLTTDDFTQAAQYGTQAMTAQQYALEQKARADRMEAAQNAQVEQQTLAAIEEFRATHPHFDSLRDQMAGLLSAKVANDLQDAYDKALRLNPELAPAAQPPAREKQYQAAKAAKAAAVSPRSTTATAVTTNPQDRRAAIAEQVDRYLSESRV